MILYEFFFFICSKSFHNNIAWHVSMGRNDVMHVTYTMEMETFIF